MNCFINNLYMSTVFIKLLILITISFNYSFGCLTVTEVKKPQPYQISRNGKYVSLRDTLNSIRSNKYSLDEISVMKSFSNFLNIQKKVNLTFEDLSFIWKALQDFAINRSHLWKRRYQRQQTYRRRKFGLKYNDIEERMLRTKELIHVNGRKMKDDSSKRRIYAERTMVMMHGRSFYKSACNVMKRIFDVGKFLELSNYSSYNVSDSTLFSRGFIYERCAERCTCFYNTEVCLPTHTKDLSVSIGLYKDHNNFQLRILPFQLVNHQKCKCMPECENRTCIEPFEFKKNSCSCECKPGSHNLCNKILIGQNKFSIRDYKCIASRRCLTPQCTAGKLTEEHLFNRRCPSIS